MIRIFIQVGSQNFHPKSVCCTLQLSILWYKHHNLQMAFIWKLATFMHNMWILKETKYTDDWGITLTEKLVKHGSFLLKKFFDIDSMCGAK